VVRLYKCNAYHLAESWLISISWEPALSLLLRALKITDVMRICTMSGSSGCVTSCWTLQYYACRAGGSRTNDSKFITVLKGLAVERAGSVIHYHCRHNRYRLNFIWRNCLNIFTLAKRTLDIKWAMCQESTFPRSPSAKPKYFQVGIFGYSRCRNIRKTRFNIYWPFWYHS
jgi:hypothetical protein